MNRRGRAFLRRRRRLASSVGGLALLLATWSPCAAREPTDQPETPKRLEDQTSTEVNKNVTDPVSTTWSLQLKNELSLLQIVGHPSQAQEVLEFQPTLPMLLSRRWKIIPRPTFTLLDSKPYTSHGDLTRSTGVGDTTFDLVLSPIVGHWLLGLGPTFVFPTANLDQTGQGKWQAGPGGVFGYRADGWIAGVIAQQWWSFAGSPSRPAVTELHLQYIAHYFFGDGWSVGTSPTIKVDWRGEPGSQVTLPIGPGIAKVVRFAQSLPVKFELDAYYAPVHPSSGGQRFIFELRMTPVVPSLINAPLLQ